VSDFEQLMAEYTGCNYAVATSSGTTALHISLLLAGVESDDYVIVPNITFVASLNSISYTGASPLLMDIDEKTWQMDLSLLEAFLEANTAIESETCVHLKDKRVIRAIMPVHVLGNMVNMQKLQDIAQRFKLVIIEDATEALGSYYKGKHSGSFGLFGCFSFNGNKIITTGGGGMIVTDSETLAKRAKHITTQAKSDPFEYRHDEIGYNYRLVNILAAIGVAQMEQLSGFIERKKEIDTIYKQGLEGIGDIRFQEVEEGVDPNCWLFTFRTSRQKELLGVLNKNKLQSRPFWVPMNQLPMFEKELYISDKDNSKTIYHDCLSVPCSTNISNSELEAVINFIKKTY
jgi:perosamine synthetase